jgi:hypothetical protein
MPWDAEKHAFNRASVDLFVPSTSGVYALFSGDKLILIEQSTRLRQALMNHLATKTDCTQQYPVSGFSFESIPAHEVAARKSALVSELQPICNQTTNAQP